MNRQIILTLVLFVVLLSSCGNNGGFIKSPGGVKWKLERFSESRKPLVNGSLVQFEWTIINEKGAELFKDRLFLKIDSLTSTRGLFEALLQLKEEEQGLFIIKNRDLEKTMIKYITSSDIDLNMEGVLHHRLMIDKIYNLEEFLNKRKEFLEWVSKLKPVNFNSVENLVIENYIDNQNMKMQVSETGLYYEILPEHSSVTTGFGKHIKIRYRGGVLKKNSSHITTTQDFYIGQELQVIKAIEEVVLLMEQGDSATIISSSTLAFGEKGSSTGLIPGGSPVMYGVRLLACD
jgi:FKBP-type peptidyl-prolyl cis-trans isomerase